MTKVTKHTNTKIIKSLSGKITVMVIILQTENNFVSISDPIINIYCLPIKRNGTSLVAQW